MRNFRQWLQLQILKETVIGDVARDCINDNRWEGDTIESLEKHLVSVYGSKQALKVLDEAAKKFKAYEKSSKQASDKRKGLHTPSRWINISSND